MQVLDPGLVEVTIFWRLKYHFQYSCGFRKNNVAQPACQLSNIPLWGQLQKDKPLLQARQIAKFIITACLRCHHQRISLAVVVARATSDSRLAAVSNMLFRLDFTDLPPNDFVVVAVVEL